MVGIPGPEIGPETGETLRELAPGGVILFTRNLETPDRLARTVSELRNLLPEPGLLAIDQEGGRVSRLEPWIGSTLPSAQLARIGSTAASRFGRATGRTLASLGFNLDFAPVVDLSDPNAENGIGDRSFGTEPETVAGLASAFLEGLQREGVAGCLKHFPGLGPTTVDSHRSLPTVHRAIDRLERDDLVPFRRLAGRAASVMVGHGHYPALDPAPGRPAILSREIVTGWLRQRIGFGGLVVSDDLEMGAVAGLDQGGRVAIRAVEAGCDLLLYCSDLALAEQARQAMIAAARDQRAFESRLREAAGSVAATAARWPLPTPDLVAWDRAREEIVEISRA
jgi:beta-N-acetylhexosaminidase